MRHWAEGRRHACTHAERTSQGCDNSIPLTSPLASHVSCLNSVYVGEWALSWIQHEQVKSKVTAEELYTKVIGAIGDPGGLIILVLRSDDGGWPAKVPMAAKGASCQR